MTQKFFRVTTKVAVSEEVQTKGEHENNDSFEMRQKFHTREVASRKAMNAVRELLLEHKEGQLKDSDPLLAKIKKACHPPSELHQMPSSGARTKRSGTR